MVVAEYAAKLDGLNRLSASVRIWTDYDFTGSNFEWRGLNRLSASVRIWTHPGTASFLVGQYVLIAFRLQSEFGLQIQRDLTMQNIGS